MQKLVFTDQQDCKKWLLLLQRGRPLTSKEHSSNYLVMTNMLLKEAKTGVQMRDAVGWMWRTHLCSVSILTGAILDSSASTGCQRFMGPQALDQVLNGARLSSAWRDNRKPGTDTDVMDTLKKQNWGLYFGLISVGGCSSFSAWRLESAPD